MLSVFDPADIYALLGIQVTHQPAGGSAVTGQAVFDHPSDLMLSGNVRGADLALRYPAVTFPCVKRGDTFLVDGVTYTAREDHEVIHVDGLEHRVQLKT